MAPMREVYKTGVEEYPDRHWTRNRDRPIVSIPSIGRLNIVSNERFYNIQYTDIYLFILQYV